MLCMSMCIDMSRRVCVVLINQQYMPMKQSSKALSLHDECQMRCHFPIATIEKRRETIEYATTKASSYQLMKIRRYGNE